MGLYVSENLYTSWMPFVELPHLIARYSRDTCYFHTPKHPLKHMTKISMDPSLLFVTFSNSLLFEAFYASRPVSLSFPIQLCHLLDIVLRRRHATSSSTAKHHVPREVVRLLFTVLLYDAS